MNLWEEIKINLELAENTELTEIISSVIGLIFRLGKVDFEKEEVYCFWFSRDFLVNLSYVKATSVFRMEIDRFASFFDDSGYCKEGIFTKNGGQILFPDLLVFREILEATKEEALNYN